MTRKLRGNLLLLLGTIFFISAPALILYSQGYRFDWDTKWFSQVGAFYFNITPARAEVFVNGKPIGKTAYALGATLSKNFSPNLYSIQITKDGYHPWEKLLEILPKQVTEAKHIILFPLKPTFVTLQDNVQEFWFAPNAIEALVQKSNLPGSGRNTWTLELWNTQQNTTYPLYESQQLQDEIHGIQWDPNSASFLLDISSREQIHSFVQHIDRNLLARQSSRSESLKVAAELRKTHIPNPLIQDAIAFLEMGSSSLWIDRKGILWRQADRAADVFALSESPFPLRTETSYIIRAAGNEFFLQENQKLYILNRQTKQFEEFFTPFHEMVLSPDGKKLALSSGNEIWIYFFEEIREQPFRSKGGKVFLTRFSENIAELAWLDSHYLLFTRGGTIVTSEIDNRDRLNMVELAAFSHPTPAQLGPNIFWQDTTKTLFVHTGGKILSSEKLLP